MSLPKKKSLLWHFYPICLLVLFLGIFFAGFYALKSMKQTLLADMEEQLLVKTQILGPVLRSHLAEGKIGKMNEVCREAGAVSGVRFTFVLPSGRVLADSSTDPSEMENHGNRVEIVRAVSGRTGSYTRYSETLDTTLMYLAVPVEDSGNLMGILRASFPMSAIEDTVSRTRDSLVLFSLVLLLLASLLLWRIFHGLIKPFLSLEEGARAFARGELHSRIPPSPIREMAVLAEAMNHMAEQLDLRIRTEVHRKNELEVLLTSMTEGVIALDADRRVLRINPAATGMFDVIPDRVVAGNVGDAIRNSDFLNFVDRVFLEKIPAETDIVFPRHGDKIVQVHASPLKQDDAVMGMVFVMQDVTRLRRLETMRRDFVANVSHEIRTPLTGILGFVEILAEEKEKDPLKKKRFLSIIERNVKRLMALVEDLLQLSSLEQAAEREKTRLEKNEIRPVLLSAIHLCRPLSEEKNIRVLLDCPEDLSLTMDTALMEQAVLNLLENALKYSPEESLIRVEAKESGEHFHLSVTDQGIGIDEKHFSRLTERFYRIEKARSRELGGTGLGLSIVKHIMMLHRGKLKIQSRPSEGSTFSLVLSKD